MDFKDHIQKWSEMFSDRGTDYMVVELQVIETLEDILEEIEACKMTMSNTRQFSLEYMYAWGKKELLTEVVLGWERLSKPGS